LLSYDGGSPNFNRNVAKRGSVRIQASSGYIK
jgi:hypothetical protein